MSESFVDELKAKAAPLKRRILFPEQNDPRVVEAISILKVEGLCEPVVMAVMDLDGVEMLEALPEAALWRERANTVLSTRKGADCNGHVQDRSAGHLMLAAGLLGSGYVDGVVVGSVATTADVLRAGIRGVGLAKGSVLMSSCFLMVSSRGVVTFGDCAVNPRPDARQLAHIAIDCARTHSRLTGQEPRVALLSFSTRGSADHIDVDLVRDALSLVRQQEPGLAIDGELQFDAAYVPEIAAQKAGDSVVAGTCNVFIFPNLSAGNIAYKIAERMAGARAIGPVIQGLAKPWMDISRGSGVEDIVNSALISAILATQNEGRLKQVNDGAI